MFTLKPVTECMISGGLGFIQFEKPVQFKDERNVCVVLSNFILEGKSENKYILIISMCIIIKTNAFRNYTTFSEKKNLHPSLPYLNS